MTKQERRTRMVLIILGPLMSSAICCPERKQTGHTQTIGEEGTTSASSSWTLTLQLDDLPYIHKRQNVEHLQE